MIRAVIIDDEKDARFLLKNLVQKKLSEALVIVGEGDDVETGYSIIREKKPDLVFLDVQMKTGTGFDLLEKFDQIDFEVIFITAYNEFAIKAFRFSAFDYLLKPIKSVDLIQSVEKLAEKTRQQKMERDKRVRILVENYGADGEIQKLVVNNVDGFRVLEIKSIIHLEGDRNYTHIIMKDGTKVTTSKNLGEYERLLSEQGFFRIHQSTVINLRHVTGFKKADDGYVEMVNGSELKVSRSRKQDFIARFS